MARKAEPGISYYRMNCGHTINKKVRLLFNEFGSDGYWIWQCILDHTYPNKGYFFDCNDQDSLELFATDVCKKQVSLVEEVIAGCVRRGLFNKPVFDMFGILSSVMMQEVYLDATKERRKKGSVIEFREEYLLIKISESEPSISIIPAKKPIIPGKKIENPGRNPQSKVEESKEEKSNSAPTPPAPDRKIGKKGGKKNDEPSEPHWQQLVDTWFEFVKTKFGEPPLFEGQDPKYLKSIIGKLKKRAAAKNIEWSEATAIQRLKTFLDYAFTDQWLATHFLLKTLDEKFESIGRDVRKISEQVKQQGPADPAEDIQRLYEKFLTGKPNIQLITADHYALLEAKGYVHKRPEHFSTAVHKRIQGLIGSNQAKELRLLQLYEKDPKEAAKADTDFELLIKRMIVMEFFYQLETNNIKTVFNASKAAV